MRTSRARTLGAAIAVLALIGTGCAGTDDSEPDLGATGGSATNTAEPVATAEAITVTAADYSFDGPVEVSGGLREFVVVNQGEEPHHMQVMRLNDGETIETFGRAAAQSEAAAFQTVTFVGGPGQAVPKASVNAWVDLEPGDYLFGCFLPDAEGTPHLALGMLAPFSVTEAEAEADVEVEVEATANDFSFAAPETMSAGAVFSLKNAGTEVHEANFIALLDGATVEDVGAWLAAEEKPGPPPFVPAGGVNAFQPGLTGWGAAPSSPGEYAFICFVPSPSDGVPHFAKGMMAAVTVT